MLGLHIQSWQPGALDSVLRAKGRVLKVMAPDLEPVRAVLAAKPDTILICRKYFSDDEQRQMLADGRTGGRRCANWTADTFVNIIVAARPFGAPVYLEGLNETGLWDDADRYNQFTVGFAETCALRFVRPAVYSFATGNPPGYVDGSPDDLRAYWAHYFDGLYAAKKAGGALALHEYSAPTMQSQESWLCLRYRRVYDILPADLKELPLLVTECGIDGGVIGASSAEAAGWRNYATAEEYAAQLTWYDGELAKDAYVLGATVFTAGNSDMWGSFDVTGVEPVLDAIAAGAPQGDSDVPKPTTITATNRPSGVPGGTASFEFDATGIDGTAKGFADVSYPVLPGNEFGATYGENMTTELPPFKDGHNAVTVKIGTNSSPLPAGGVEAEIHLRLFELDGQTWDGGVHGPFPMTVAAAGEPGNPSGIDLESARIQLDTQWGNAQIARQKGLKDVADAIEASVIALKSALGIA